MEMTVQYVRGYEYASFKDQHIVSMYIAFGSTVRSTVVSSVDKALQPI